MYVEPLSSQIMCADSHPNCVVTWSGWPLLRVGTAASLAGSLSYGLPSPTQRYIRYIFVEFAVSLAYGPSGLTCMLSVSN